MPDNVDISAGVGTSVATDDVGGVHYQKLKLDAGGDGVSVPFVAGQQTMAASVPVVVASNQTAIPVSDGGGALTVDGTVAVTSAGITTIAGAVAGTEMQADVLTLPDSIDGPGAPTVESYTSVKIDLAASSANQVLVAAPGANKQIWVYGLFMMADTAAGTVTIQDEDDTALTGTMAVSDEGGWVLPISGNFAMPWIKVATNKALEADTGACTVDGLMTYAIVSV